MTPKRYTDPLGSALPALEQKILKQRGMEMLLVMFYAEELKRDVLDRVQTTDDLMSRLAGGTLKRVPKGTKDPVDKALDALIVDGAITAIDKKEIKRLIDYRNVLAHQMHDILADVSPNKTARDYIAYFPDFPKYDYNAVQRLQYFRKLFDGMYRTHHYATTLRHNRVFFEAAEKTFLTEIKRLQRVISRLIVKRKADIKRVNEEISLKGTELGGDYDPGHPLNQYDDGRLTKRGVEICYRLYDLGKSAMTVAHLMGLSLRATKKRKKQWAALGGINRPKSDLQNIPHRKFYRRYDD